MSDKNNPHILGTERIGKLLLQYSIPAIIGMTVTSMYNIIDSIFIGHGVGAMAISGLAISFPLMNLIIAISTLVGVGGSAISSIRLGQKDLAGATEVLGTVLTLCLANSIIFGSLFLIFLDPILTFFGASDTTLPYAHDFMQVILFGTPISYTMISLNNVMRATGYPKKAMLSSMITVVANVIIAPIFIFQFHWGIKGAALATVISQFIGMVWVLHHFINKESYVHFEKGFYKIRKRIVMNIFSIGMAPFLMNVCACIIVIIINNSLQNHGGDMAIGAYGIINRVLTLFVMIVLGLTMGMQPIIGYNYGANQMQRVKQTLKAGIIAGVTINTLGFILCELFPHAISMMFTNEKSLVDFAATGLKISILAFPFVGSQIVISNFFQSIGKAKVSIFLSLSRQLLYLLPCLLIFPPLFGTNGVWWSSVVSDSLAFITAMLILINHFKKINKKNPALV
jgi:putative efflux protein, MATE family